MVKLPIAVAVAFVERHFAEQVPQFIAKPDLQEYQRVTGAGLSECQLATEVVRAAGQG